MDKIKIVTHIFTLFVVISILLPVYWMLILSFKSIVEATTPGPGIFWVKHFSLEGWKLAFANPMAATSGATYSSSAGASYNFLTFIGNSLIIILGGMAVNVPLGLLAAYAFSRYKFKGDNHIFFWFLTNRMAPAASFLLPYYHMYSILNLIDTYQGMILVHTVFNLPLTIWVLKGFIDDVPQELDEAASVDGYGLMGFFRHVLIPMVLPGIAVACLFIFIFSWNEFLFAQFLTHFRATPLTYAIYRLIDVCTMIMWHEVGAVTLVSWIPAAIFVVFMRKYITRGFMFGAVK